MGKKRVGERKGGGIGGELVGGRTVVRRLWG